MRETPADLDRLQRLLDDSYAHAGAHLRSIFTPERRLDARDLSRLLTGVRVLNLATVTAAGSPRVAPVDGLFYQGYWHFGSSTDSARFRHIRARPAVSASHTVGEKLAVVVHGVAHEIDVKREEVAGFRTVLAETYGAGWEEWGGNAPYAWIEPHAMFTFHMPAD